MSAFIKSLRGNDPDAALYWLAAMIAAGEDPRFIARRLIISASEDVGNADPRALQVAVAAAQALDHIGLPEAQYALAQATTYIATAPKSNSIGLAFFAAAGDVEAHGSLPVPLHLRNAAHRGMKQHGIGVGYRYPHDFDEADVAQQYLPDDLRDRRYYLPTDQGYEATLANRMAARTEARAAGRPKRSTAPKPATSGHTDLIAHPGVEPQATGRDRAAGRRRRLSRRRAWHGHPDGAERHWPRPVHRAMIGIHRSTGETEADDARFAHIRRRVRRPPGVGPRVTGSAPGGVRGVTLVLDRRPLGRDRPPHGRRSLDRADRLGGPGPSALGPPHPARPTHPPGRWDGAGSRRVASPRAPDPVRRAGRRGPSS